MTTLIANLVYCAPCLGRGRQVILGDRIAKEVLLIRFKERRIMVRGGHITLTCPQCGHDERVDNTEKVV